MDAFACNIAHTHADDADPDTRPVMLVTAAVDSMTVVRELGPCINEDLQLRGYCSYVGRSSVEVVVELAQASATQPIVTATFLLVRLLGSVTIRSPHYADCCRCLLLCLPMRVHRWPRTHSQSRRWPSTLWCHKRRWTMNGGLCKDRATTASITHSTRPTLPCVPGLKLGQPARQSAPASARHHCLQCNQQRRRYAAPTRFHVAPVRRECGGGLDLVAHADSWSRLGFCMS